MEQIAAGLHVTLRSALHIGAGFGLAQLIDDRMVQGPHPRGGIELPYIPGSSLKGRLRHTARLLLIELAWPETDRDAALARLFGTAALPGSLTFRDAHVDDDLARHLRLANENTGRGEVYGVPRTERSFVSLSRERRVALDQRLFRIEAADAGLHLIGPVTGALPAKTHAHDLALLAAAARLVVDLGGHTGRGLGACRIELEPAPPDLAILEAPP